MADMKSTVLKNFAILETCVSIQCIQKPQSMTLLLCKSFIVVCIWPWNWNSIHVLKIFTESSYSSCTLKEEEKPNGMSTFKLMGAYFQTSPLNHHNSDSTHNDPALLCKPHTGTTEESHQSQEFLQGILPDPSHSQLILSFFSSIHLILFKKVRQPRSGCLAKYMEFSDFRQSPIFIPWAT